MSARRRRSARRDVSLRPDPARTLDIWWQVVDIRGEWLGHALSTEPSDRTTAEEAIGTLYDLLDHPRPEFVWAESPAAAARIVGPEPAPIARPGRGTTGGSWPLENRLAGLAAELRGRLDRRIGRVTPWPPVSVTDPVAELQAGASLRDVIEPGVRGALRRVVRKSVSSGLRAALPGSLGLVWRGQHDVEWVAHHDVHRRALGTRFAPTDTVQLELWAAIARSCGWWWPRADRCVIAERPSITRTEPVPGAEYGEVRLHAGDGPAVAFRDGWSIHAWHGTPVPSWVVDSPTVDRVAAETNAEVRRCAIERIGWSTFIDRAGLSLVGRADDPGNPGCELQLYDLPFRSWGSQTRLLLAVNGSVERDGTRRRYGLRVPGWFDDPIYAAGWSYGLSGAHYRLLQRRT